MPARLALLDLSPEQAATALLASATDDWTLRFRGELDRQGRSGPLRRLMNVWDLSGTAAARLFGVSRQAWAKWLHSGVPPERAVAVADLAAATDVLDRYVRRDRIPAVVRRPAEQLGGRSLLDLAEAGEHRAVLLATRWMFDLRRIQP
ncbi:MAG: hypothetical protein ACYDAQ_20900 [Mycobacteriales bacterium]